VAIDFLPQVGVEFGRRREHGRSGLLVLMAPGQVADDGVRPATEIAMSLLRHPEHLRDDDRRNHGEVGDQVVGGVPGRQRRQQLLHHGLDPLLPSDHRPPREHRRQALAQPDVIGAVGRDHRRRLEPRQDLRVARHRRELLAVVGEDLRAVVEAGDHPAMNDLVPHHPAFGPGLFVQRPRVLDCRPIEEVDVQLLARHSVPPQDKNRCGCEKPAFSIQIRHAGCTAHCLA
jgi:hypothetical protein